MGVSAILHRSSLRHPSSTVFVEKTARVTYREAWLVAQQHRQWIEREVAKQIRRLGHASNERGSAYNVVVAYLSSNHPDYLLSVLGCSDASSPAAPASTSRASPCVRRIRPAMLNYRWTHEEIAQALRVQPGNTATGTTDAHLTIILYGPGFENEAEKAAIDLEGDPEQRRRGHRTISIQMPFFVPVHARIEGSDVVDNINSNDTGTNGSLDLGDSDESDAIILFTSGTSSKAGAKGVRLSHRALLSQAMAKVCPPCSYDSRTDMVASTVPFFHVGGISSALAILLAGGTLTFPPLQNNAGVGSFQPHVILDTVDELANTLVVVPAMVHSLLYEAEKNSGRKSYQNVRLLLVGGQSLTSSQLARARVVFPKSRVVQTYACTEAGSSITFTQLHPCSDLESKSSEDRHDAIPRGDCVGHAPPHIEVQIFRESKETMGLYESSKIPASTYETGVIATRGPHVMNGYWKRGSERRREYHASIGLTTDGWLITNDRGYCDFEGRLFFAGRASDVIRSGGETIEANEVERVIEKCPSVEECAVFALPDEKFGETCCVAVVLKDRKDSSTCVDKNPILLEEVKRHCSKQNLASYKRPKRLFLLSELPKNSSGKILKHKLVERFDRLISKL